MQLLADFQQLEPASGPNLFNAVQLTDGRQDFLGKDQQGAPVFLVADECNPVYRPVVQHRHLSAAFCMLCRLNVDGVEVVGKFALIRFEGNAPDLHELFIRCVRAAIADLPASAQTPDIEARVNRLLGLFRALARPAGREISGLWAELFCIAVSGNVPVAVDRWHTDNTEAFDFSWGQCRLEVKCTVGAFRIHEFSLEQLQPPSGGSGYVASLVLKVANGGEGVLDLAKKLEAQLQGETSLQVKLWALLVQSLGSDFSEALDRRFDADLAAKQLKLFRMDDIPSLPPISDSRISSVRFKSDLSSVQSSCGSNGTAALKALF
ncbi:MAG: PD-(D/E)XK motif protein [Planctomycetota bacterium]